MALIRFPVRILGLALVALALVLLVADIAAVDWATRSGFTMDPLGELLYGVAPEMLNASQAFIQRYVWPPLWDPMIQTVLTWWDVAVFAVLGGVLAAIARRPQPQNDPAAVETAG